MELESDPYYRRLLFIVTALFAVSLLLACWIVAKGAFTPIQILLFGLGLGLIHAPLVLIGHELGHASSCTATQSWTAALPVSRSV